jgi:hypothetical protein
VRSLLAVAAALTLGGCGADERSARTTAASPLTSATAPADAVSVAEAKATAGSAPLRVRGYVIRTGGGYRLCDGILESEPPQCGGPSLRIAGGSARELRTLFDGRERVTLLGEIHGDAIAVGPARD